MKLLRIGLLILEMAIPCLAQLSTGWAGVNIGSRAAGSDAYSDGVYSIPGSGTGLLPEGDQKK